MRHWLMIQKKKKNAYGPVFLKKINKKKLARVFVEQWSVYVMAAFSKKKNKKLV